MKNLEPLTDPVYSEPARFSVIDRFFIKLLRDKRDLPFVHLTLKISFTLIPIAVLLYLPEINNTIWWIAAITYLVLNNFVFKGPYGLMLHCTSHRIFFKKKYNILNKYLPWVVGPFFGQSPETYYAHHIGMHHPENNLTDDISSTMPYKRDSLRGFIKYFTEFFFLVIFQLSKYFSDRKRFRLMFNTIRGELIYFVFVIAMAFVNFQATLVVFIIPFFLFRIIAMLGNWAQHAFISPDDPANEYKNSITCINTKYNHKCWNDGYHISHHLKPAMHWTEHPHHFLSSIDEYVKNEAIVFEKIHFLHVFVYLMTKRYDKLARHYVNLGNRFNSDEEVIAFLKQRTARIPHSKSHNFREIVSAA